MAAHAVSICGAWSEQLPVSGEHALEAGAGPGLGKEQWGSQPALVMLDWEDRFEMKKRVMGQKDIGSILLCELKFYCHLRGNCIPSMCELQATLPMADPQSSLGAHPH